MHEPPLARIDAANPDLPHPLRPDRRRHAADLHQCRRTKAAQARDRHAVKAAARAQVPRVEISVRIEPDHPQRPQRLATVARNGRHRPDAQTVIAAEQNRQPPGVHLAIYGAVHLAVPGHHLRQVPIPVQRRKPRVRRSAQVAAIDDIQAAPGQCCRAARQRAALQDPWRIRGRWPPHRWVRRSGSPYAMPRTRSCQDFLFGDTTLRAPRRGLPTPSASPPNRSFGSASSGIRSIGCAPPISQFRRCR